MMSVKPLTNVAWEPSELDASHYKNNSKSQYSQAQKLLQEVVIQKSDSILDVGCGHGEIIATLSQLAPQGTCVGVDPSNNMIEAAADTFPEGLFPNLHFQVGKAEEMQFDHNSFDLIVCTNVFMWIRDPAKAIELMSSFLKPGGNLLIFTYDKNTPYVELFESVLHEHFFAYASTSAVRTMLSIEDHERLINENSMTCDKLDVTDIVFSYKNEEEFKNYILGWLSCYIQLPEELHANFIEKVIEKSEEFNISGNQFEIVIPHRTIAIKARKF